MQIVYGTMARSIVLVGMMLVGALSLGAQVTRPTTSPQSSTDILLQITKQVILSAAKFGLDEAGTRIMGSSWRYVKEVVGPVYNDLASRYPALKSFGTSGADGAATRAVADLDSDPRLRMLLVDRFDRLDSGQAQILLELAVVRKQLEDNNRRTEEVLRRLDTAQPTQPQSSLKPGAPVDQSATVDRVQRGVKEIVAHQLGISIARVVDGARYSEDLGADPLDVIEIFITFEEAFKIQLRDDDIERLISVGSTITEIVRQLNVRRLQ